MNPRAWARWCRRRCWRSRTAKPPLTSRRQRPGAAGGVSHALGVPGAPPLREICPAEVTSEDAHIDARAWGTQMGNVDRTTAVRIRGAGVDGLAVARLALERRRPSRQLGPRASFSGIPRIGLAVLSARLMVLRRQGDVRGEPY